MNRNKSNKSTTDYQTVNKMCFIHPFNSYKRSMILGEYCNQNSCNNNTYYIFKSYVRAVQMSSWVLFSALKFIVLIHWIG